jgi:hypothetical protein
MFRLVSFVFLLGSIFTGTAVSQEVGDPGGGGGSGGGGGISNNCDGAGPTVNVCLIPDRASSCSDFLNRPWIEKHAYSCQSVPCHEQRCTVDENLTFTYNVSQDDWLTERVLYKSPVGDQQGKNYKIHDEPYPCEKKHRCFGCRLSYNGSIIGRVCKSEELGLVSSIPRYVQCIVNGASVSCGGPQ